MTTDEIRERYLAFFAERDHTRIPSSSLIPPASDRSVLLTTAGMQPLKPYFLGVQSPPASRLTSCQKCFRAVDIENVGNTARHLTFFEMLGNFSIGDYFKQGAIELAWQLSREVFGFAESDIWVTVFAGDERLGLGPDEEAIELWRSVGVPDERIVACPRSENFWEAGAVGPAGPCSELYVDRGVQFGAPEDLPGGENERFLEYWNLVFMQYNQDPHDQLKALPSNNIDTGMGLNRMAAILQEKPSVFETDQFQPLIELGEELSGARYGEDFQVDRALRILADHARGATFIIADGVVPSNEERGYVLRRLMRRAIQQGRKLQMPAGFLARYGELVEELMGDVYHELIEQRAAIATWLGSEEESFRRTLEQGSKLLEELIEGALEHKREAIAARDAFTLHDTYGFPFELTRELAAEHGLEVEQEGFSALMEAQRTRARAAASSAPHAGEEGRERAQRLTTGAGQPSRFLGYETERLRTTVQAVQPDGERLLVKLAESPFYPPGGGQVSDVGMIECEDEQCLFDVTEVYRLDDDQVLSVIPQRGELRADQPVIARVDQRARHATEANHTATHLLHAALRARLGDHVRQAGSYVGPDKLRFDFSHGQPLSEQELTDVVDQVNEWILANDPVEAITTTLVEARRLGAMALFGEKYGDLVRMVQIGDGHYSRELCGGTHVRRTAEIGLMRVLSESSSAANVRRIEALTGPAAVDLVRQHDTLLRRAASTLRTQPENVPQLLEQHESERRQLLKQQRSEGSSQTTGDIAALAQQAVRLDGAQVLTATVPVSDAKALLDIADHVKGRLEDAAIVLGGSAEGRVFLVASVAPALVERGVKAGEIVKAAAAITGGGGGGRDTMAQAGGRHPEKLPEALQAAHDMIAAALSD
jgi:alanyl-tRNA synthetase